MLQRAPRRLRACAPDGRVRYKKVMAVPPANPIPKPRSFLRRQFLPTWEERKRMFAPQAWIVLGGSYLAVIFAYVLPEDFRNTAPA